MEITKERKADGSRQYPLDEFSGCYGNNRRSQRYGMKPQAWPTCGRPHEDGDLPAREVLLKAQILVRCHEHLKIVRLRGIQQIAVRQIRPTHFIGRDDRMYGRRWLAALEQVFLGRKGSSLKRRGLRRRTDCSRRTPGPLEHPRVERLETTPGTHLLSPRPPNSRTAPSPGREFRGKARRRSLFRASAPRRYIGSNSASPNPGEFRRNASLTLTR